jgi:hypothetical protein
MNSDKIDLTLALTYGEINNRKFDVVVEYNQQQYPVLNGTVSLPITLPADIYLCCSGKTIDDTVLSPSGEILVDMCVKIKSVQLDHFKLSKKWINNHMLINSQGQQVFNYIGFNDRYKISLDKSNIFTQYYHCQQF